MPVKIPNKITPDSIKDSFVEYQYITNLPFNIIIGIIFNALDDTFTYTNGENNRNIEKLNDFQGNEKAHIFYNKNIHVRLYPNRLLFNCNENYIGWDSYIHEIENVLKQISNTQIVEAYSRIGIRYISEYPNQDLKNCTKLNYKFNCIDNVNSKTYNFSTNFLYNDCIVNINLHNNYAKISRKHIGNIDVHQAINESISIPAEPVSVIDIDVIKSDLKETDLLNLINITSKYHLFHKEIFFSLLDDDFLQTLNPEY